MTIKQQDENSIKPLQVMAKNNFFLLFFLLFNATLFAQEKSFYWIELNNKTTSTHSISSPETFLTQAAIDRRVKQNISITEQDLPVPKNYIDEINGFDDVEVHNTSRWMNAILIKTHNLVSVNQIKALSYVKNSDSIQISGLKTQTESQHKFQSFDKKNNAQVWFTNPTYGPAYNQIHLHNGEILHEAGNKGEGMTIAIIDAGFTGSQANLSLSSAFQNKQILGVRNFIENSNDVYKNSNHGTYVFTTIAGNIDGTYLGTCPNANYWLLMSEDVESETIIEEHYWLFAAEYADSVGVDVINTSLGYTEFDDASQNHTYADMDGNTTIAALAADIAASKGILLFNSNGNSGSNSWRYLGTPADADSVIAVGATDSLGVIAPFSSLGPTSDGDIKPNIVGQGFPSAIYHNDGYVDFGSGTSFSGPILCGLGTCLWQAFPDKTNMEIKTIIEESAHIYNTPDEYYGYGIPDFAKALNLLGVNSYPENYKTSIFPTLVSEQLTLQVLSPRASTIQFQLYDNLGKLIYQTEITLIENKQLYPIDIDSLSLNKGVFHVVLNDENNFSFSTQIIKR